MGGLQEREVRGWDGLAGLAVLGPASPLPPPFGAQKIALNASPGALFHKGFNPVDFSLSLPCIAMAWSAPHRSPLGWSAMAWAAVGFGEDFCFLAGQG